MVEITPIEGKLVLEVLGWHKLWALKSALEIPLEHIKSAYVDPNPAMGWFAGLKIVGTDIPHIFRAGMFWQEGNKVFWDVRHPEKTIVLELEDEGYAKLIIEVEDPEAEIQKIHAALSHHASLRAAAETELDAFLHEAPQQNVSPSVTPGQEAEDNIQTLHTNAT